MTAASWGRRDAEEGTGTMKYAAFLLIWLMVSCSLHAQTVDVQFVNNVDFDVTYLSFGPNGNAPVNVLIEPLSPGEDHYFAATFTHGEYMIVMGDEAGTLWGTDIDLSVQDGDRKVLFASALTTPFNGGGGKDHGDHDPGCTVAGRGGVGVVLLAALFVLFALFSIGVTRPTQES